MSPETTRLFGPLFHGWWELFALFCLLLVAVALLGWAWNRGLRPADRGPAVYWPLLVTAYALLLLVRHVHDHVRDAVIIAAAVMIAGFFGRDQYPRALWVPVMLLGALLGFGLNLSALMLTLASALVLLFSVGVKR